MIIKSIWYNKCLGTKIVFQKIEFKATVATVRYKQVFKIVANKFHPSPSPEKRLNLLEDLLHDGVGVVASALPDVASSGSETSTQFLIQRFDDVTGGILSSKASKTS